MHHLSNAIMLISGLHIDAHLKGSKAGCKKRRERESLKIINRWRTGQLLEKKMYMSSSNGEEPNYKQWTTSGSRWSNYNGRRAVQNVREKVLVGKGYVAMGLLNVFQNHRTQPILRFFVT